MQHDQHVLVWRAHHLLRQQLIASVALIESAVALVALVDTKVATAG